MRGWVRVGAVAASAALIAVLGACGDPDARADGSVAAAGTDATRQAGLDGSESGTTEGTAPIGTEAPGTTATTAEPTTTAAPTTTAPPTTPPPTVAPPPPPPIGGIPVPINAGTPPPIGKGVPRRLAAPAPIELGGPPAFPGEGEWTPIGPTVDGTAAMYATNLRAGPGSASPMGVAWIDPGAIRSRLHPGTTDPGGPFLTLPFVPADEFPQLAAAINGGFKTTEYHGGFFLEAREAVQLQGGKASFAIDNDGVATIGAWGRDVTIYDNIASVRQNLDLLVDGGQAVGGLNPNDTSVWGATLNNVVWVPRSAIGVRADGALVWVGGPLNITSLATLLVQAGAVRGMELDINPNWVSFNWFAMNADGTLYAQKLNPNLSRDPYRFTVADDRDFFAFLTR